MDEQKIRESIAAMFETKESYDATSAEFLSDFAESPMRAVRRFGMDVFVGEELGRRLGYIEEALATMPVKEWHTYLSHEKDGLVYAMTSGRLWHSGSNGTMGALLCEAKATAAVQTLERIGWAMRLLARHGYQGTGKE